MSQAYKLDEISFSDWIHELKDDYKTIGAAGQLRFEPNGDVFVIRKTADHGEENNSDRKEGPITNVYNEGIKKIPERKRGHRPR